MRILTLYMDIIKHQFKEFQIKTKVILRSTFNVVHNRRSLNNRNGQSAQNKKKQQDCNKSLLVHENKLKKLSKGSNTQNNLISGKM